MDARSEADVNSKLKVTLSKELSSVPFMRGSPEGGWSTGSNETKLVKRKLISNESLVHLSPFFFFFEWISIEWIWIEDKRKEKMEVDRSTSLIC